MQLGLGVDAEIVVPNPELREYPVVSERVSDGQYARIANFIVCEVELREPRVDSQRVGDGCCARIADLVVR